MKSLLFLLLALTLFGCDPGAARNKRIAVFAAAEEDFLRRTKGVVAESSVGCTNYSDHYYLCSGISEGGVAVQALYDKSTGRFKQFVD